VILGLGVWVVIDQFVYPEVGSTTNNKCNTIDLYRTTAFSEVISLIQQKLLLVKISSICLKSKLAPFYKDMRVVI
jgi:predicted TIM-barrel fold metal-dependent hydrolase